MALEFTEEFLKNLLDEVTVELNEKAKTQVAQLAKSEDSAEMTPGDSASQGAESKDVPAPDMDNDGKIGDLDGKPEAPNDASNAATVEDENAPEDAKAADVDADLANPEGDASPGIEALQAEYEDLDDECLHDHFLACKGAILARMGVDEESAEDDQQMMDAPAPGAAPAMDAAPMADAPPAPAPEMGKKEPSMSKVDASLYAGGGPAGGEHPAPAMKESPAGGAAPPPPMGGAKVVSGGGTRFDTPTKTPGTATTALKSEDKMKKSEAELEIESLKARLAKQEEETIQLIETIAIPMRKSIKGVSEIGYIAKTDALRNALPVMSKEAAIEVLREKARTEDLKKSDRSLINGYCLGNIKYEEIAHLLTDVK